jgi:hypothetical protein
VLLAIVAALSSAVHLLRRPPQPVVVHVGMAPADQQLKAVVMCAKVVSVNHYREQRSRVQRRRTTTTNLAVAVFALVSVPSSGHA